jgi:hypothetical protein
MLGRFAVGLGERRHLLFAGSADLTNENSLGPSGESARRAGDVMQPPRGHEKHAEVRFATRLSARVKEEQSTKSSKDNLWLLNAGMK